MKINYNALSAALDFGAASCAAAERQAAGQGRQPGCCRHSPFPGGFFLLLQSRHDGSGCLLGLPIISSGATYHIPVCLIGSRKEQILGILFFRTSAINYFDLASSPILFNCLIIQYLNRCLLFLPKKHNPFLQSPSNSSNELTIFIPFS